MVGPRTPKTLHWWRLRRSYSSSGGHAPSLEREVQRTRTSVADCEGAAAARTEDAEAAAQGEERAAPGGPAHGLERCSALHPLGDNDAAYPIECAVFRRARPTAEREVERELCVLASPARAPERRERS